MNQYLLLFLSVITSCCLMFVIHTRTVTQEKEIKKNKFQSIKLQLSVDVLEDTLTEHDKLKAMLEQDQMKVKELEDEVKKLKDTQKLLAGDLMSCQETKSYDMKLEAEALKADNDFKAESTNEKSTWENEVASLKSQMASQSKVCNYLTTEKLLDTISQWCPEQAKAQKQKEAEAPKQEEQPKAEAPKQEEQPKAEAPKQEEQPKAEAPKQEEQPKAEAPKQEEQPKAEAPKQEEQPKAEAPKQEEQPKAEAPKQEEQPKAEAPKQEEQPKAEAPKKEEQ